MSENRPALGKIDRRGFIKRIAAGFGLVAASSVGAIAADRAGYVNRGIALATDLGVTVGDALNRTGETIGNFFEGPKYDQLPAPITPSGTVFDGKHVDIDKKSDRDYLITGVGMDEDEAFQALSHMREKCGEVSTEVYDRNEFGNIESLHVVIPAESVGCLLPPEKAK